MKAIVYKGPEKLYLENIEKPRINKGEALIKVSYAGICGTDVHTFEGKYRTVPPMVLGHEFSGEIVEIKCDRKEFFKVGDKVVSRPTIICGNCFACKNGYFNVCESLKMIGIDFDGAFAEYVKVPINTLYKIPKRISLKQASLIEPLAVAVHSIRNSDLRVGDDVVIFGAGPIGMLLGLVAKISGASSVFITDINDFRVKKAKSLGLDSLNIKGKNFLKYIQEKTLDKMADISFDAAGVDATAEIITDATRIKGQIVIVSTYKEVPRFNLFSILFKEQKVIGTRIYLDEDYIKALALLKKHPEIEKIVTNIISLKEVQNYIRAIINNEDVLKILIDVNF